MIVRPLTSDYTFETKRTIPRVGVMLVGWGGNNGSTLTAGVIANRHNISWCTKEGTVSVKTSLIPLHCHFLNGSEF